MNIDTPVQLSQKIQYLHEKIDLVYQQAQHSPQSALKMDFIEFVDHSIARIYRLSNPDQPAPPMSPNKQRYSSQPEQERIAAEKKALDHRLRQLTHQEQSLEIERLRLEVEDHRLQKERVHQQYQDQERELKQYVFDLEKKVRHLERETERLYNMNGAQAQEIGKVKEERKRAEKGELDWRERYQSEIGVLETFNSRKNKYSFRPQEGLSINRVFTNTTSAKKGCQTFFLCELPLRWKVVRLVFGIKIGMMMANRQVQYFKEITIFEKEDMLLSLKDGVLTLEYLKRKVANSYPQYKLHTPQVVIMLFGRGDSVSLDETRD